MAAGGKSQHGDIRADEAAEALFIEPLQPDLHPRLVVALAVEEETDAGDESDGEKIGDQQGDDQGGDQVAVDLLGKIADKENGEEDGDGGHRAGEDRPHHLLGALDDGRFQPLFHLLEVALDILQHHHCVVHQHAQRQDDGGIDDDVEVAAHKPADSDGAEKDHGDGGKRRDDRPEIA